MTDMRESVRVSIGSYKARLADRKGDVLRAVEKDSYWEAQIALLDCVGYKAAIEELEFQSDVMAQ